MSIKTDPEIDKALKDFTVELYRILFKKKASFAERSQMVMIHIAENKVWACYMLAIVFALGLVASSFF